MASDDLQRLMHAVLDGQASPDEVRALEARLAAEPAVRAEFEAWRALFGQLGQLPQVEAPADLLPSIRAALRPHQLSAPSSVIEHGRQNNTSFGILSTLRRLLWPGPPEEFGRMSINRKLAAGGAFAVVAIGIAAVVFDYPPKSQDVMGTIAPAERYRAPQAGAEAVKLGDQTIAQLMQSDAFDRIVKDPELSLVAKQAGVRELALAMNRNSDASRAILASIDASRVTVEHKALAELVLADVAASQKVLEALAGNQAAADKMVAEKAMLAEKAVTAERAAMVDKAAVAEKAAIAEKAAATAVAERKFLEKSATAQAVTIDRIALERAIRAQPEAARLLLKSPDASRLALVNADLARVMVANLELSRFLLSTEAAARLQVKSDAQRMVQSIEATRLQVNRLQ